MSRRPNTIATATNAGNNLREPGTGERQVD